MVAKDIDLNSNSQKNKITVEIEESEQQIVSKINQNGYEQSLTTTKKRRMTIGDLNKISKFDY